MSGRVERDGNLKWHALTFPKRHDLDRVRSVHDAGSQFGAVRTVWPQRSQGAALRIEHPYRPARFGCEYQGGATRTGRNNCLTPNIRQCCMPEPFPICRQRLQSAKSIHSHDQFISAISIQVTPVGAIHTEHRRIIPEGLPAAVDCDDFLSPIRIAEQPRALLFVAPTLDYRILVGE